MVWNIYVHGIRIIDTEGNMIVDEVWDADWDAKINAQWISQMVPAG